MNNKNDNISQFDELFKQGLENHSVKAPSGVFEAVSAATSSAAAGAKLIIAKWIVGGIVATTLAVGGYYAVTADKKPEENKGLVSEMQEANSSETIINLNSETTNSSEKTIVAVNETVNPITTKEKSSGGLIPNDPISNKAMYDTMEIENFTISPSLDHQLQEKLNNPKQTEYSISLTGNVCNGGTFNLSLNTTKKVEWFVNDEKLVSNLPNLPYQFLEKKEYRIIAYCEGKKVADTFINMAAPKVVIDQQELGSDAATLTAKTSEIKSAQWMYNGKALSTDRQFAFDKRLYQTTPYLVTTDKHGCKDTFKATNVKEESSFKIIQTVITPNGDGKNDDYEVQIKGYDNFIMIISDINGKPIFTTNTPEVHWDGKDQRTQIPCKDGEYAVYISYKLKNSIKTEKKYGKVTLTK